MSDEDTLKLFLYNCAVVHGDVRAVVGDVAPSAGVQISAEASVDELAPYVSQFSEGTRKVAAQMAVWYVLFHMLENDIRSFISDTLEEKDPADWWNTCVPEAVKFDVTSNRTREQDFGLVPRSEDLLDYTTFGQLGDIIRANWDVFGGILSSQKAVSRVMATLNALRGPIAHCGMLAADEIDRLKLSVKDWFRLMEGPQ